MTLLASCADEFDGTPPAFFGLIADVAGNLLCDFGDLLLQFVHGVLPSPFDPLLQFTARDRLLCAPFLNQSPELVTAP